MRRRPGTLRLLAIAVLALGGAGTVLAQDDGEEQPWPTPEERERIVHGAEGGDAEAQYLLALVHVGWGLELELDYGEAFTLVRRSAEARYARAQVLLAGMLATGLTAEDGNVIVERDEAAAARWCRRAAEQGNGDGQFCLAGLYITGTGVEQDDAEAVRWLRLAGCQGVGVAQGWLGDLYDAGGLGVAPDPEEADAWYRRAADETDTAFEVYGMEFTTDRGPNMDHLFHLGAMYRDGGVVAEDIVAAYKWMSVAVRWSPCAWVTRDTPDGPVTNRDLVDRLAGRMSADELAEAERAAEAFLAAYRPSPAGDADHCHPPD